MACVEINHVTKTFGPIKAVDDVSVTVNQGEFFGLLGPNGAGKTTTIRIVLDIFKPDSGTVSILDGSMTEEKKNRIGYMPEERGLYQDLPLERVLTYLASLKGLAIGDIRARLDEYLERFDLTQYRKKKVKELSKGMQQKAQIISTIIHKPELLIIDEPFSGLDPVNTQMVKDLLRDLHRSGTTVIMSTHQMHQVEELCDRILLVNQGKSVLYGRLADIRRQFSGHALLIRAEGELPELPGILSIEPVNGSIRLNLAAETSPQSILRELVDKNVSLEQFEIAIPTLDEIFIQVVQDPGTTQG
jgi:ABC-2 type transport system ATP-binding protein